MGGWVCSIGVYPLPLALLTDLYIFFPSFVCAALIGLGISQGSWKFK